MRSRARCSSPTIASADTSQNEQMRNVPSSPERPSSVSSRPIAEDEAVLAQLVRDREHASCAGARRHAGRNPKIAARSVEASSESVA